MLKRIVFPDCSESFWAGASNALNSRPSVLALFKFLFEAVRELLEDIGSDCSIVLINKLESIRGN